VHAKQAALDTPLELYTSVSSTIVGGTSPL